MSDSLWPHGLLHTRLICPLVISWSLLKFMSSESVMLLISHHLILCCPLFLLPQSFPASESFSMNWLFELGGQSIGTSGTSSVLSMNIRNCFPLGLTGLISLLPKGLWRVFSSTTVWKHLLFGTQPSLMVQLSYLYMTTGKIITLTIWTFVGKLTSLLFNTLSRFVSFPSKEQISLNFMAAVTVHSDFGAQENVTASTFPPSICHEVMGPDMQIILLKWLKVKRN